MKTILRKETGVWVCVGALSILLVAQLASGTQGAHVGRPDRVVEERPVPVDVVPVEPVAEGMDGRHAAELLVAAIVQVESAGEPERVGRRGERGLMQIRRATWRDMTRLLYGRELPFDQAFDPGTNRHVGERYLAYLQSFIYEHRDAWRADERTLLLACYNAGPERVRRAGFDPSRLPSSTRSYIERASALHDFYLKEDVETLHRLLAAQVRQGDTG